MHVFATLPWARSDAAGRAGPRPGSGRLPAGRPRRQRSPARRGSRRPAARPPSAVARSSRPSAARDQHSDRLRDLAVAARVQVLVERIVVGRVERAESDRSTCSSDVQAGKSARARRPTARAPRRAGALLGRVHRLEHDYAQRRPPAVQRCRSTRENASASTRAIADVVGRPIAAAHRRHTRSGSRCRTCSPGQ